MMNAQSAALGRSRRGLALVSGFNNTPSGRALSAGPAAQMLGATHRSAALSGTQFRLRLWQGLLELCLSVSLGIALARSYPYLSP